MESPMHKKNRAELTQFYRHHLLEDIMPFWQSRTLDKEQGGYFTCFDRQGNLTDTDKYIWMQGRQLWMFSAIYNQLEPRQEWLNLAQEGRDFLVAHAYAGNGRWFYQLDRQGQMKCPKLSFYTDAAALSGLCEFAQASNSDADQSLIEETFAQFERNFYDPDFNEYHHFIHDPNYKYHGKYMITLNVCTIIAPLLGEARTRELCDHCLEQILNVFAKDEHQILFEAVGQDGSFVDSEAGRIFNPGHAIESMWFCMEIARQRNDQAVIDRCIQVIDWAYEKGIDKVHGGFFNLLDSHGRDVTQSRYYQEIYVPFDELWDDKCWWPHAEALYALLLAAELGPKPECLDRFYDLHDFCQKNFFDPEFGEWYESLNREGKPKLTNKGASYKGAFHLPRALMLIVRLLDDNETVAIK
jgi:N-acylglucosamine 2-epimerase